MANYVWLFLVAGGAAILGVVLALGSIKQEGKRSIAAIAGAFAVAAMALVLGLFVSSAPTAPMVASDSQSSEISRPARQSDQNALPGLGQPNR
jgi:flagellar motor component MotA